MQKVQDIRSVQDTQADMDVQVTPRVRHAYAPGPPEADLHAPPEARSPEPPEAEGQGIAFLTVLGILAAVVLLVSGIVARIRLVQLSEAGLALEAELAELETERTRLQIAYESAFNLGTVETYAREKLGMSQPEPGQIEYIDIAAPDRARVLNVAETDGWVDRIADALSAFPEYFRLTGE